MYKNKIYLERPDILNVYNCSEVDVAGGFYQYGGKNYDKCCDYECQTESRKNMIGIKVFFIVLFLAFTHFACMRVGIDWGYCRRTPVRNDNNTTRYSTERPNISTISANIRQPSRPIATATPSSTSPQSPQ